MRGYSIKTQIRQVRTKLGICPQHDVIWPELTVYDHLFIYAGLKGVPYKNIKQTVENLIDEIGLTETRFFQASLLSGGQRRKLCLAMAFVGGSDVIFLDEPTSGMDPVTRRGVWDFLNANKKGRTIVLTTHFMDEGIPPSPPFPRTRHFTYSISLQLTSSEIVSPSSRMDDCAARARLSS